MNFVSPKGQQKPERLLIAALLVLVMWPAGCLFNSLEHDRAPGVPAYTWRTVERVIDGDTIVLNGDEKVRLIGVDVPETVHPNRPVHRFGKAASEYTRRLAEGKRIWLEYDLKRTDKYGRTLAYVHFKDGRVLNEEIIRHGYGRAYTWFPFKYKEKYRKLEQKARKARIGLWAILR